MFSNEDVTIGSWMLAMNVNHEDSKLLCQAECTASSIAVWDIPKCSGAYILVLQPEGYPDLASDYDCTWMHSNFADYASPFTSVDEYGYIFLLTVKMTSTTDTYCCSYVSRLCLLTSHLVLSL